MSSNPEASSTSKKDNLDHQPQQSGETGMEEHAHTIAENPGRSAVQRSSLSLSTTDAVSSPDSILREAKRLVHYPACRPVDNAGLRNGTNAVGAIQEPSSSVTGTQDRSGPSAILRDAKRIIHYPAGRRHPQTAAGGTADAVQAAQPPQDSVTLTTASSFTNNPTTNELTAGTGNNVAETNEATLSETCTPRTIHATLVEEGTVSLVDRERIEEEVRNQIMQNTVVGEAVVAEEAGEKGRGRGRFTTIICLFIGIGMIAGGAYLGTRNTSDASNTSDVTAEEQARNSNSIPTTGTFQRSEAPSMSPTSGAPTMHPTRSNDNLNNSKFEEAHPLLLPRDAANSNATVLSGPLSSLTLTDYYDYVCGTSAGSYASTEQDIGLWYQYRARVSGPVTVLACGDVYLSIFIRSDWGSGVSCFYENVWAGNHKGCNGGSSRSWQATEGTIYYVLVHANTTSAADWETNDKMYSVEIVDNDECEYAYGPIAPTSVGVVLSYTTLDAGPDHAEVRGCRGASAPTARGVWYLVEGTGQPITASTCSEDTDFDTQLSVFSGDCGNLACIEGNNNFCGSRSTVSWQSVQGETYHLLVHGSNNSTGTFSLTLSTDAVRVVNDFCSTATEIPQNATYHLQDNAFWGATADAEVSTCTSMMTDCSTSANMVMGGDVDREDFPLGVWYTFEGTGGNVLVSMSDDVEHRLEVVAFRGDCGNLQCMGDSITRIPGPGDGWCGTQYALAIEVGEKYYLLVSPISASFVEESYYMEIDLDPLHY